LLLATLQLRLRKNRPLFCILQAEFRLP
jgi:hypothetical protein